MALAGFAMALVNAVWQSALLVLLAGLLLRVTRSAAAAHAAVWTAVLFASAALVPLDLAFERTARVALPTVPRHAVATSAKAAPGPMSIAALSGPAHSAGAARDTAELFVTNLASRIALPLLVLWSFVALWLLGRLLFAVFRIRQLKARAELLEDAPNPLLAMARRVRGTRIGLSDLVAAPCAVGFARPMVLLPRAFAQRAGSDELIAVVAHELAHLRRRDDFVQLAQRIATGIFCINPVMGLISRRVDFYREAACDDEVVDSKASALRYAECLASILARAVQPASAAAPALVQGQRQMRARVERLVNWREGTRTMGRVAILIALAVCATAMFFVRVELPVLFPSSAEPVASEQPDHHFTVSVSSGEADDSLIAALSAAGYRPSVDELIALTNASVSSDLIVAIRRSGMHHPSISELINLANAGVDEDLVTASVRTFGDGVSANDLIGLQNAGVDSDDLASYRRSGDDALSVHDVIALHQAGVDADYVRHLAAAGHGHLSVRDMIRLHEAGVEV
jgi:beta-lactamase regulating signal transducer with metallopeptidase domain